ncbi:hypothetical protein QQS21_007401 [Conoideocrella luteorostrata]|uniref:Uncharacterized protein n=1 Tax=Conoideocrella luteorostrata TaxID=1105319 RepID=A0AAJ0CLM8_9HYPO|nr:hypothetical protein QQS21_007401 [Conoideocrella luteorostrata]
MKLLSLSLAVFVVFEASHGWSFQKTQPRSAGVKIAGQPETPNPLGSFDSKKIGEKITIVYRADSRSPEEIEKAGGFYPKPGPETAAKYNLYSHIKGNIQNTAYVSTTQFLSTAVSYARNAQRLPGNKEKQAYIYKIETSELAVDVNRSLRILNFGTNGEHAFMGGIPNSQIMGYVKATEEVMEDIGKARFRPNPKYRPVRNPGSSVHPELAVFPPGHPALHIKPWRRINSKAGAKPGIAAVFKTTQTMTRLRIKHNVQASFRTSETDALHGGGHMNTPTTPNNGPSQPIGTKNKFKVKPPNERPSKLPSELPEGSLQGSFRPFDPDDNLSTDAKPKKVDKTDDKHKKISPSRPVKGTSDVPHGGKQGTSRPVDPHNKVSANSKPKRPASGPPKSSNRKNTKPPGSPK